MPTVELSAGTIEYEDTGGGGPVIVFQHGLLMDGSLWRYVVDDLRSDHRCVIPTLPLGGHRSPMHRDADLSMRGIASLLGEFIERLDLRDVTLAVSDWGGGIVLVGDVGSDRVGRLVLTPCEAFDNVPPGLPGRMIGLAARIPGGVTLAVKQLGLRPFRRLPIAWGWMSRRLSDEVMDAWFEPAMTGREVRRDLRKYVRSAREARRVMIEATERLREFERPALVAWASEDRVMPPEHGRRLAEMLPQGRLVEIADSYTLVPVDQPLALAAAIRDFMADNRGHATASAADRALAGPRDRRRAVARRRDQRSEPGHGLFD
jgi:pimeloyl-ACP methyl ester carboxylesterase